MPIVNRIAEFEAELIEWRHQLHKFPELGFEEHQTAEFIAEKLNQMGLDVNRGLAGTGVVATLTVGSGNGPKIGLRADMDALPILERSDFDHASKNLASCMLVATMVIQQCFWVQQNILRKLKILMVRFSSYFNLPRKVKVAVKR